MKQTPLGLVAPVQNAGADLTPPAPEPDPRQDETDPKRGHDRATFRAGLRAKTHMLGKGPVTPET
jgi:hypothetical protein